MVKKFLAAGTMAAVAAVGSLLMISPAQAAGTATGISDTQRRPAHQGFGACALMRPAHQPVRNC